MRKTWRAATILMLVLMCVLCASAASAEQMRVTITAACDNYNHVGYNWTQLYRINGVQVRSGDVVEVGSTFQVYAELQEQDKYPDVGYAKGTYEHPGVDFKVTMDVVVEENQGRYAGCQAVWKVTMVFKALPKTYPGLTRDADGKFRYYKNGVLQSDASGLVRVGGEFYLLSWGVLQEVTTLVQYDGAWFYVTGGVFDKAANGIYAYDGSKFLVSAGQVRYDYSGLFQNASSALRAPDNKWYFIANGQIQTQYTGLAQYDGHWFYLINGILAEDYTGEVIYNGATFHVQNGMIM